MSDQKGIIDVAEMFRPPINRSMRVLDRSFFRKKVPLAAARVFDQRNIPLLRTELKSDVLQVERIPTVTVDPRAQDKKTAAKSVLLRPEIRPDGR